MTSQGIVYEYEDGGTYCGEWERDSAHGYGCGTGPGGLGKYEGLWEQGGQVSGVYTWPHGMKYMGSWKTNKREGLGKETREDGTEYVGEFIRGARGPYGITKLPSGVYRGSWRNGRQDGEGEEVYIDGGCYRGQYKNGVRSGFGSRTSAPYEHRSREISKIHDKQHAVSPPFAALLRPSFSSVPGLGGGGLEDAPTAELAAPPDMQIYEGEWRDDKRHGYGVMKCIGSYTYYGQWSANTRTGYGVLMSENGVKEEGQWQNGELIVALKRKKFHMKSHQLETKVQTAHTQAIQAADTARNKAMLAESRSSTATGKAKLANGVVAAADKNAQLARQKAEQYKHGIRISEGIRSPVSDISMPFPPTPPISRPHFQSHSESRDSARRLEVASIPHVPSYESLQRLSGHSPSYFEELYNNDRSIEEETDYVSPTEKRRRFSDRLSSSRSNSSQSQSRSITSEGLADQRAGLAKQLSGSEQVLSHRALRDLAEEEEWHRRSSEGFRNKMGAKWESEQSVLRERRRDKKTGEIKEEYNSDEDQVDERLQQARQQLIAKPKLVKKGSVALDMLVKNLNQMANWNKMIACLNFVLLIVLIILILVVVLAMYYYQLTSYYNNHTEDMGPSTSFIPLP